MKTKILVGIALSLTIILAAAVSNYLFQLQPAPPKNQDMQITGVDFCSDGIDIIVYFENKGLKAFTFKPQDLTKLPAYPLSSGGGGWCSVSYGEVVTVAPQEKLNLTYEYHWTPDAKYEFHVDGVYEGTDYRIRIRYETRSPVTYPYYLEITGSLFSPGNKTYDELGAVKRVGDSELTLLVVNHHDTITFTVSHMYFRYNGILKGKSVSAMNIAPKETVTITSTSDWKSEPTQICLFATYEVETNSTRYPFFTGQMWGHTYSNYYTHEPTN